MISLAAYDITTVCPLPASRRHPFRRHWPSFRFSTPTAFSIAVSRLSAMPAEYSETLSHVVGAQVTQLGPTARSALSGRPHLHVDQPVVTDENLAHSMFDSYTREHPVPQLTCRCRHFAQSFTLPSS